MAAPATSVLIALAVAAASLPVMAGPGIAPRASSPPRSSPPSPPPPSARGTTAAAPVASPLADTTAAPVATPAEGGAESPAAPAGEGAMPAYGTYSWPVRGPVLQPFRAPETPYGPGHRGIDIGAPEGAVVAAPADGIVAFAGSLAGSLFVSIDHPDGVRTTYSWLSAVSVRRGERVLRGAPIAATGRGHATVEPAHLHFGARIGDTYIDPMLLLEPAGAAGLIHLAPLDDGA